MYYLPEKQDRSNYDNRAKSIFSKTFGDTCMSIHYQAISHAGHQKKIPLRYKIVIKTTKN